MNINRNKIINNKVISQRLVRCGTDNMALENQKYLDK